MIYQKLVNLVLLLHKAVYQGLFLFSSVILSILIANSPLYNVYYTFIMQKLGISLRESTLSLPINAWINELLMSIFFLVITLEMKREIVIGYLKSTSQRVLPTVSAFCGVIFPALIYIILNMQSLHKRD